MTWVLYACTQSFTSHGNYLPWNTKIRKWERVREVSGDLHEVMQLSATTWSVCLIVLRCLMVRVCCVEVDETLARTAETAERLEEINARMESVTKRRRHWPTTCWHWPTVRWLTDQQLADTDRQLAYTDRQFDDWLTNSLLTLTDSSMTDWPTACWHWPTVRWLTDSIQMTHDGECDMLVFMSRSWNVNTTAKPECWHFNWGTYIFACHTSPSCVICFVTSLTKIRLNSKNLHFTGTEQCNNYVTTS